MAGIKAWQESRYWHLLSRFAAASAVATVISQVVFLASYSLGAPPTASTVLAWLAGAIPNFLLNRRTWGGGKHALRAQVLRYAAISVGTALLAAVATNAAESVAHQVSANFRPGQVAIVWSAFVGTYLAMFVVKFFLVDRLVFTSRPQPEQAR